MNKVEAWLNSYTKASTRKVTKSRFKKFLEYAKQDPEELLKLSNPKLKTLLLNYQTAMLKEYSQNTVRTMVNCVRAFFTYYDRPLSLKHKIVKQRKPKGEHKFSIEDLRAMFSVADTRDKAILSLACALGWESSGFLSIEIDFMEKLIKRARSQNKDFLMFEWEREKSEEEQIGILTPMVLYWCEQHINKVRKENPEQTKLFDLTNKGLNLVLRNLVKESGIVTIGKVRFHLIRKWLMGALNNAGLTGYDIDLILGKAIPIDKRTYLQNLEKDAFEKYKKAYPLHLSLSQDINGKAKYNELVDLVVKQVKAQQNLVDFMKQKGLLETLPSGLQNQLNQVYDFARIMEKKNGEKPKEEKER